MKNLVFANTEFANKEELREWLSKQASDWAEWTDGLWAFGYRNSFEIASTTIQDLQDAGVRKAAASALKRYAYPDLHQEGGPVFCLRATSAS